MTSQLAVPESPERSLRRQPSATRITVSTVRPVATAPAVTLDTTEPSPSPDQKSAIPVAASIKVNSAKTLKSRSKLRARPRRFGARALDEGEDGGDATEEGSEAEPSDEDEDDDEEEDDDSDSDASVVSSEDEAVEAEKTEEVGEARQGDQTDDGIATDSVAAKTDDGSTESRADTKSPVPDPVASLPMPPQSDAQPSSAGKMSWAAIADEDDDLAEIQAFEAEMSATAAFKARTDAAKKAEASGTVPQAQAQAQAQTQDAALAAKERKKLKVKERRLRKKAEKAAAASANTDAAPSTAPSAQPSKTSKRVTDTPRATQESANDRAAKPPAATPRVGGFWGHDERLLDGDSRKSSGFWRGRGGRGGMGVGRGGYPSARPDARLNVAGGEAERGSGLAADSETPAERVPPHLRQNGSAGRGAFAGRGGAGVNTRGGRGGARGGYAARGLGPGAFGAYAPGPAPPGRSKLRGWDDDEDVDDDAPKVDYDALEGKAVREPSRAARPAPQPATPAWADASSRRPNADSAKAAGGGVKSPLAGVPTAPRAMLKAAADATNPSSQQLEPAPDTATTQTESPAAPEQEAGGLWAHDGFAELQRVEATRGPKRAVRGGASGSAARGGANNVGRVEPRAANDFKNVATAPSNGLISPGESVSSPHRDGVPLDGKDGVFVSQSASRSNSVAGRDSPVVFGSVDGDQTSAKKFEPNPRAASFALAQASGQSGQGASVRLPGQHEASLRAGGGQQGPPAGFGAGVQVPYSSVRQPTSHMPPSQASSVHSGATSGTPPLYPMGPPAPITMAPSLPPGFAVDATGMVFDLTGGQPVAMGYLPPMQNVAAAPMSPYYPGVPYGEESYARGSPAGSAYQPSSYGAPSAPPAASHQPRSTANETSQPSPTSPSQRRESPTHIKKDAPGFLPPHMQQASSTRSALGKHSRTLSTLPASAAKVPAFRPSASPAPSASGTGPENVSRNQVPRYVPQPQYQQRTYSSAYSGPGSSTGHRYDDQGQVILNHAMSQVHIGEHNGYGTPNADSGGAEFPYGFDAYAAQMSPPTGTVYYQQGTQAAAGAGAGAGGYGADPYEQQQQQQQQAYDSRAYYGSADMHESDPAFYAAAYERQ
ncbi:hypothetical protein A4X09_0g6608 [Tilletia walkeri]|uniref:Btz domain-containing protein n=1 Tax=Tilletia walkeri TaxID=117179 RepID=A0A8X7T1S0_9BASI|nr:hypothetical protein A4X09_0g6608 [Tilletia walkeri]